MRRIGVLTSDFSLYHDLVRALRDRGIAFASLAFGQRPGPSVGVVLTSWRDALGGDLPEQLPVVVVPLDEAGREDVDAGLAKAVRVLEGVEGYVEVVVGVDPGHRPGVALLADGRLLHAGQVFRVADAAGTVRALLAQYPHERGLVRIGHGAPHDRDQILSGLWDLRGEGIRFEVVDESGTTPFPGRSEWPPDVAAAIAIARTPGRQARHPGRAPVAQGQVREVQRASRTTSGGRVTLSREEAQRVVRGERTLGEALEERKRRPRARKRSPPSSD